MSATSVTAAFIDYDEEGHDPGGQFAAEARYGLVQFRKRPKDTTCQHPLADFGKPEKRDGHTVVSCCCLGCGLTWQMCRVLELPKSGSRAAEKPRGGGR